jgi:hypothetical protein
MKAAFPVLLMWLLIAGQGCALSDDCGDPQDIAIARVGVGLDTLITQDMYHITLVQGLSIWDYGPEQFANPRWAPPEVQLCGHGGLSMAFAIRADDGSIVSAGSKQWNLSPDRRYLIGLMHADERHWTPSPTNWVGYPIVDSRYKTSEHDSIFLIWSINSISNPVQY